MTRKTTPSGKQARITLREFRATFNKVVPLPFFDALRDEVAATFPSKKPDASVTISQFRKNIDSVLGIKRGSKLSFNKPHHHGAETLLRVMREMPTLKKAFLKEQAAAEERRRKEKAKAPKPRKRSAKDERIENLEREVASLRQQVNNRPVSAEEEARVRKWYEDNDTRIGGGRSDGPRPGLRD